MADTPDRPKPTDVEMRPEYDFRSMRGVVRGEYAARFRERLRPVRSEKVVVVRIPHETPGREPQNEGENT